MTTDRKKVERVWVLNWRFELEDNSQQTERVETKVFRRKTDALLYAMRVLREQRGLWDFDENEELATCLQLRYGKVCCGTRSCLVQLSDSDNLVFELSRKTVTEEKARVK